MPTPKASAENKKKGEETQLIVQNRGKLASMSGIGMENVDPIDIKPPQILLVQKSSNIGEMIDRNTGKTPLFGQFFHTGKQEILDFFDCYFIYAAKQEWIDRRKGGEPVPQYAAVGMMIEPDKSLSLIGMKFRKTSYYALSSLFTQATSQKLPMFMFKCHVTSKLINGQKGDYHVVSVKTDGIEEDEITFRELYDMAAKFSEKSKVKPVKVVDDEDLHGGADGNAPSPADDPNAIPF